MMIAIAFESVVKLVAFVLVGFFTFELCDGFKQSSLAKQDPQVATVFSTNFSSGVS